MKRMLVCFFNYKGTIQTDYEKEVMRVQNAVTGVLDNIPEEELMTMTCLQAQENCSTVQ